MVKTCCQHHVTREAQKAKNEPKDRECGCGMREKTVSQVEVRPEKILHGRDLLWPPPLSAKNGLSQAIQMIPRDKPLPMQQGITWYIKESSKRTW